MPTPSIKDFMISRVRTRIIELFFTHADEMMYVREITRATKQEINAVRRELERMYGYGLVKKEERSNRLYYFLNKDYLFYDELLRMVSKTKGLGKAILKNRRKLGSIDYVAMSAAYVEGQPPRQDRVDLLVIGDVVLAELQALVKAEEAASGREINYTVFSREEFDFRKTRRDPFVMEVLYDDTVMVIGSSVEFSHREIPGI